MSEKFPLKRCNELNFGYNAKIGVYTTLMSDRPMIDVMLTTGATY